MGLPQICRTTIVFLAFLVTPWDGGAQEAPPSTDLSELKQFYDRHDFFALRDALAKMSDPAAESPQLLFFRAATEQAFNQPRASNEIIDSILKSPETPPVLALELRALQLTNHMRLHRYALALEDARAILSSPAAEPNSILVSETRNTLPLLAALADVPPQESSVQGPSRMALGKTKRVPLTINGKKFQFALDTGANFSVIMHSEARQLGLEIRPADLLIATSTAKKVFGDVAVAAQVTIGNIRYRHVVFLVLPDELLSFPGGQKIPGLLGFPVVEAMGEVRFRRDNVMEVPARPQRRRKQNVALHDLDPLIQVRYGKDDLLCRLDTGANHTVFYEPFFQRYRQRVESIGHQITAQAGGVGGIQEIPAYRVPRMSLTLAAAGVNLRRVEVYSQSIRQPEENFLFCNVGLDVLGQFRSYAINFRDMALVVN